MIIIGQDSWGDIKFVIRESVRDDVPFRVTPASLWLHCDECDTWIRQREARKIEGRHLCRSCAKEILIIDDVKAG